MLIIGISFPPEPFLLQTAVALHEAGVRLRVGLGADLFARVEPFGPVVVRMPPWNIGWMRRGATFVVMLVLRLATSPLDTVRLIWLALMNDKRTRFAERLQLLYRMLPMAGLRPDLVHFQWNSTAIEYEPLREFFRCPTVISCRGSQVNVAPFDPRRPSIADDLRRTLGGANAVHCVSGEMAKVVMDYGVDPERIRVIRPAVDTRFFCAGVEKPDAFAPIHIVMTGSLLWRKGYEYALLAVRYLLDRGMTVTLEIVGDGPGRQHVQFTASDLRLDQVVTIAGHRSREGVRASLRRADIFLLSSVSEGISNAALEAMACGLPIVTTDCGGMREAVTHGVEGFVTPVRDAARMSNALERLCVDAGLRKQFGTAARRKAVSQFDTRDQAAHFRHLYQVAVSVKAAVASSKAAAARRTTTA